MILSPHTNPPGMYFAPNGLAIKLRMVPSAAKYAFDWQSGGNPLIVASYSPTGGANGAPTVTLTSPVPQSLAVALAANTGPRLQIVSAGAVVPQALVVTSIDSTNTVLTLASMPAVTPISGDNIYPWGPMATSIANQVRSYIDSLGPSRQSGYADPTDPWEDICAIARLEQVALNATDADGTTRFASNVAAPATINGISQDVQAQDNFNGVELLWASSIVVCD
jgi:hypothetical protein